MRLHILLVTIFATITTTTTVFSPYEPGPHSVTHVSLSPTPDEGLIEELDVWVPSDAGIYSTFYFLDGFGGYTPGEAYNKLFHHLASHGVAVVLPWSFNLPVSPKEKVLVFISVLEWTEEHLQDRLHQHGVQEGVMLDLDNIVLGGHSAGAHVQVEYLKGRCGKVKGQVLYSPVDGVDPFGLIPEFCITPGHLLNYVTPTLHLAAGYDAVPGVAGYACAPEELSNMRFYNAMDPDVTPRWTINTTDFAHADMLDDIYRKMIESTRFCGFNPDLTSKEHQGYREFVGGQTAAFVKALFTEDEDECGVYLAYLQDPNLMTVQVETHYSNPTGRCPRPSCTWQPPINATEPQF